MRSRTDVRRGDVVSIGLFAAIAVLAELRLIGELNPTDKALPWSVIATLPIAGLGILQSSPARVKSLG